MNEFFKGPPVLEAAENLLETCVLRMLRESAYQPGTDSFTRDVLKAMDKDPQQMSANEFVRYRKIIANIVKQLKAKGAFIDQETLEIRGRMADEAANAQDSFLRQQYGFEPGSEEAKNYNIENINRA